MPGERLKEANENAVVEAGRLSPHLASLIEPDPQAALDPETRKKKK